MVALVLAVAGTSGCAMNSLPRIDPTGQRLLLWPDEPTPTVSPLATASAPTLVPGTTAAVPTTPSNTSAPPVYTDPYLPGSGNTTTDWLGRPVVVGPPVATSTGQPVAAGGQLTAYPPGEAIRIAPGRVIAPVGSEVILVSGVCAQSGYLRTNERIEWMLDRAGTGQIVTVGARGELDMFRWPQNMPRKIDNYFAIGATSPFPECLNRGTADPNDDVQIRKGDAWISVTSPVEGTSYITAYAPDVESWNGRTAQATIYWIDAQWVFPTAVTLAPGEAHTLTTLVTRQSDGAPIAGWIVRYKAVGGSSVGLGYGDGTTTEQPTDNQGRSSVQITPTDNRGGTTNIEIEIIRPEQAGVAASPRVSIAKGTTSITWADGGISGSPMPVTPGTGVPLEQTPSGSPLDSGWGQPTLPNSPYTPGNPSTDLPTTPTTPANPPASANPDLRVLVEQITPNPLQVGDTVEFKVTITNEGNGTAYGVNVLDEFDVGMTSDIANPGQQYFSAERKFDLAPGKSSIMNGLTFRLDQAGRLSHRLTVSADNSMAIVEPVFLNVQPAAAAVAPSLQVELVGPDGKTVGEVAQFRIKVTNTGSTAATNLEIQAEFNPELKPSDVTRPFDEPYYMQTGKIRWSIPRLEAGGSLTQEVYCQCTAATLRTGGRAMVAATGLAQPIVAEKSNLEIRPARGGTDSPLGGGTTTSPPATTPGTNPATGGLQLQIASSGNPRVQQRFTITATLTNNTGQVQQGVKLRVLIPASVRADTQQIQASAPMQVNPWASQEVELIFGPVAQLAPGERITALIPATPIQSTVANVNAETSSVTEPAQGYVQSISIAP